MSPVVVVAAWMVLVGASEGSGDAGTAAHATSDLDTAVMDLLEKARDPVRVAVAPVLDEDKARADDLAFRLTTALRTLGDVEVVSARALAAELDEAEGRALGLRPERGEGAAPVSAHAADHVLLGEVSSAGGAPVLSLRLLHVESGEVLSQATVLVEGTAPASTVAATTVQGSIRVLVDELARALSSLPGDPRYQRVAVAPLEAQGEAVKSSRVDRFVQAELTAALAQRGFLVVERARLDQALEQIAVGTLLGDDSVPALGKALDAQAVVLGSVSEAGEVFTVNARVVAVDDGAVLGAAAAALRRENTVTLASGALETRTAADIIFRSLIAPGWGQLENGEPAKGVFFAAGTYGAAGLTLTLAGAALFAVVAYQLAEPDRSAAPGHQADAIIFARNVRNGLVLATGAAALGTAALWGMNVADATVVALTGE